MSIAKCRSARHQNGIGSIGASLLLLALGACADVESQPTVSEPQDAEVPDVETALGVLPPQQLPPGRCGMFLWSRAAQPKLVFFSQDGAKGAKMAIRDEPVDLTRVEAVGESIFGQYEQQRFTAEGYAIQLTVQVERRSGVIGGAVVERGALRLTQIGGWEIVVPVAGLIACQSG